MKKVTPFLLRRVGPACMLLLLAGCGEPPQPESDALAYNVDAGRISVSGLSSGANMATQLHIVHSGIFRGAAILAGGPYYCAEGAISRAVGLCVKGGEVPVDHLVAYARGEETAGRIDPLDNLADDRVWIFHGTLDDVVNGDLTDATAAFYAQLMPAESIASVNGVAAVHGVPTLDYGPACDSFASPYINACDYDAAGNWLLAIYGELEARVAASGELRRVTQPGAADADMLPEAFLYVPDACAAGDPCGIHVAIHGCLQSSDYVGDELARHSGINEWAESNHLLVLYPQVASSRVAPLNPLGCWDWWGYTGEDYATRSGPQIRAIKAMLDALAGTTL